MSGIEFKATYTVPELGRLMGVSRFRALRLLKRIRVPIQEGSPGIVFLADLKLAAPALWSSLEEAAHLRGLARGGEPAGRGGLTRRQNAKSRA